MHVSYECISPEYYSNDQKISLCSPCFEYSIYVLPKTKKMKPQTSTSSVKELYGLVNSDLLERFTKESFEKSNYYITFIKEKYHYACVDLLKESVMSSQHFRTLFFKRRMKDNK